MLKLQEDHFPFANAYFIIGNAYAGESTTIRLLAEKRNGSLCEENCHDRYFPDLERKDFSRLCYTRDLVDWHDFIRRKPDAYEAWINGASRKCEGMEIKILEELAKTGKPVFVDANLKGQARRSSFPTA